MKPSEWQDSQRVYKSKFDATLQSGLSMDVLAKKLGVKGTWEVEKQVIKNPRGRGWIYQYRRKTGSPGKGKNGSVASSLLKIARELIGVHEKGMPEISQQEVIKLAKKTGLSLKTEKRKTTTKQGRRKLTKVTIMSSILNAKEYGRFLALQKEVGGVVSFSWDRPFVTVVNGEEETSEESCFKVIHSLEPV